MIWGPVLLFPALYVFSSVTQPVARPLSKACSIDVSLVATLSGDAAGLGEVLVGNDHIFLATRYTPGEIAVFRMDGTFLRYIGRQGQGPGEFEVARELYALPGERLLVLDTRLMRATVITYDGEYLSSWQLEVLPRLGGGVVLADSALVFTGEMSSRRHFGAAMARQPLHGGETVYYGSNEVEDSGPLEGRVMPRLLAFEPRRGLTAMKRYKYELEFWNTDGSRSFAKARSAAWLTWPPEIPAGSRIGPPETYIKGIQYYDSNALWVLAQVTPENWAQGVDLDAGKILDRTLWTDARIELIDPESLRVLCYRVIDPYALTGFVGPNMIGTYDESEIGEPLVRIWRLSVNP